ncbi:hypothetical protein [uncultured Chitinophaga sp.]|uniref:hypothetical protein n=1 Tax=uncultured Chitinophaga sp. TaxID=339340 RepID=UPI0025DF00E6|nr:hypothetical protein [uncultured Chitinophaga sp.]
MSNWERKAVLFMDHTSKWDIANDCEAFVPFAMEWLRGAVEPYLILQVITEDSYTARIKNATPSFLEDLAVNPGHLGDYIKQHLGEVIFWRDIPKGTHVFGDLLSALSSAVVIPLTCKGQLRVILLGWSVPQLFDESFRVLLSMIKSRINSVLEQSSVQQDLHKTLDRFSAILHTVPQAIIFIDNSGFAGWVNERAAVLLELDRSGEHSPSELSAAMGALRAKLINKEDVNRQAAEIFNNPDVAPENWIWEISGTETRRYRVSSLPLKSRQLNGSLWMFEMLR